MVPPINRPPGPPPPGPPPGRFVPPPSMNGNFGNQPQPLMAAQMPPRPPFNGPPPSNGPNGPWNRPPRPPDNAPGSMIRF